MGAVREKAMRGSILTALVLAGLATPALSQSDIDAAHKFSWGENIGWMNWRDAGDPAGSAGVRIHQSFLSGFVWCENVGWLNLGDGAPADGEQYGNTVGEDSGVNLGPDGGLTGFAWGENFGWVNFSGGAMASPPQPARIDFGDGRMHGFAWGENVGWINLGNGEHYVGIDFACPADFNRDGMVSSLDVLAFLNAWNAREPLGDFNDDGTFDSRDIMAFLNAWSAGCA